MHCSLVAQFDYDRHNEGFCDDLKNAIHMV